LVAHVFLYALEDNRSLSTCIVHYFIESFSSCKSEKS
jgi:hypothetical protein